MAGSSKPSLRPPKRSPRSRPRSNKRARRAPSADAHRGRRSSASAIRITRDPSPSPRPLRHANGFALDLCGFSELARDARRGSCGRSSTSIPGRARSFWPSSEAISLRRSSVRRPLTRDVIAALLERLQRRDVACWSFPASPSRARGRPRTCSLRSSQEGARSHPTPHAPPRGRLQARAPSRVRRGPPATRFAAS